MTPAMEDYTDAKLDELCQCINHALYTTDPMYTCCVENNCTDEYFSIAESTVNYMLQGENQRQALEHALRDSFDDLVTSAKVDCVMEELEKD